MFYREENPALFDCLVEHIKKLPIDCIETELGDINPEEYDFTMGIPQKLLNTISYLHISKDAKNNVQSLEGIQKLKNLDTLIISTNYEDNINWDKFSEEELKDKQFGKKLNAVFNLNQIDDITPLYACKNLEVLQFCGQRSIKEIDLSNWLNLKMLDMYGCFNLRTIKGLDKLNAFNNLWKAKENEYSFEFYGCNRIERVEGFLEVAKKCSHLPPKYKVLQLPMLSFFKMLQTDPKIIIEYLFDYGTRKKNDFVVWVENTKGPKGCLVEYSAKDMLKLNQQIKSVVNKVCDNTMSSKQKMYAVYSWITKNVEYDYKGLNYSDGIKKPILNVSEFGEYLLRDDYKKMVDFYLNINARIKQTKLVNNPIVKNCSQKCHEMRENLKKDAFFVRIREVKQDRRIKKAADIRSTQTALFDKKGVCVGISNLYNTFLVSMGYEAMPCFCRAGDDNGVYWGDLNHQISQCEVLLENGQLHTYFFDPTLDLGCAQKKYFCLNKEEMEQDHDLSMECFDIQNAPSQQVAKQNSNEEMQRGV